MRKLKIIFPLIVLLVAWPGCRAQSGDRVKKPAAAPEFLWSQSLPIHSGDPGIAPIGGTEARALLAFDGSLFAGIGYWMDTEKENPGLPGAQVLRLDGPHSSWQVDLQLDARNRRGLRMYQAISTLGKVHFTTDKDGQPLAAPADFLLASVWKRGPGLDVFARKPGASSRWQMTSILAGAEAQPGIQIRAFGQHKDRVTGVDMVFAGVTSAVILTGKYDGSSQNIVWNRQPELRGNFSNGVAKGRVSSFAECNGKLYAAAYDTVYERQDGASPSWNKVFVTTIHAQSDRVTGLRGLTCMLGGSGQPNSLLVTVEDNPSRIYRIFPGDTLPGGGYRNELDLNVSSFLTRQLGTRAAYAIVAYNDMLKYPGSGVDCSSYLAGLEVRTPEGSKTFYGHNLNGYFLVRDCSGAYALRQVRDRSMNSAPPLVSVRTIARSPFAGDPQGTIYAGGFDANSYPVHNTAWIYKGVPASSH